jgi:hypothetical protein
MKSRGLVIASLMLGAIAALLGCSARQPAAEPTAQSEIELELAKLSPADRELALAQKICPISDEPLGSMGKPLKIEQDGRVLFICCAGCEEDVQKDFEGNFKKVQPAPNAE